MIKVGVIREGKNPPDMRVPLTPKQCVEVARKFPELDLKVEASPVRAFKDSSYSDLGTVVVADVSDADVLIGVKEVPLDMLVPNKTYFFFSHTTKEQPYNRELLQTILAKKIRIIDYEGLTDENGVRIIGFGYYAGIVGAYNGIKAWGLRHKSFELCSALKLHSLAEMGSELEKAKLPNIKIALTGAGKVATGVLDVMQLMGIKKVSPEEYVSKTYTEPVFTQLRVDDYNKRKDGKEMPRVDFYKNYREYDADFMRFAKVTDLYIAGHFYAEDSPFIFTREDAKSPDFKIQVVADISCDIDGPVASTLRPSTIADPMYGYHAASETEVAFDQKEAITVMAVDNLPCEFPTVASEGFGNEMVNKIIPQLFNGDAGDILKRATIAENGKLSDKYAYLQNFVDGK
ncbi:MAG: alanine dehydrogenase [Salibacteraceae bacterium]|jgi:alanine dehydrogenase